jgi:hypothetical protein
VLSVPMVHQQQLKAALPTKLVWDLQLKQRGPTDAGLEMHLDSEGAPHHSMPRHAPSLPQPCTHTQHAAFFTLPCARWLPGLRSSNDHAGGAEPPPGPNPLLLLLLPVIPGSKVETYQRQCRCGVLAPTHNSIRRCISTTTTEQLPAL